MPGDEKKVGHGKVLARAHTIHKGKVHKHKAKMKPRITAVGAVQGIRVTYPDDKKGGLITHAFVKKYNAAAKSMSPNEIARQVGIGKHKYGTLNLPLFEEPIYVDSGESVGKAPGNALVIGNDNYDETKRMGTFGPQNRKLKNNVKDADKVEKALKSKGFKVTKLTDVTGKQIKNALNLANSSLESEKSFVFSFSGHGTFEGMIGTDGDPVAPKDLVQIVNKAIEVNSDVVILLCACHQGITVDHCRTALFDRAKKYYKDNDKIKLFIEAATKVAAKKDKFQEDAHEIWKKIWQSETLIGSGDSKKIDEGTKLFSEQYKKWPQIWNKAVDAATPQINEATNKAKTAGLKISNLNLKKFSAKEISSFNQDHEKKMWAQLDSVDYILNQAVSVYH